VARADGGGGRLTAPGRLKVRVLIRPKQGILDPQGQAVERALPALGFEGVESVNVGRLVELEVADLKRVGEMCEQLLANPLIEDYEIEPVEGDAGSEGSVRLRSAKVGAPT
jgi:phosphoribosylformylglycinamidine synthase PurS subunit